MEPWMWIVIAIVIIVIIAVVVWMMMRPSRRLKKQFGPEYDRVVRQTGDKNAAQEELQQRLERHDSYSLRELNADEQDRYVADWRMLQRHFAKQPATGLLEADELITRLLDDVGYPTDSFEQQAADLSASHADVVDDYRDARAVVRDTRAGSAGTEEIRQALLRYRRVFEQVAETQVRRSDDEAVS
jgi:uncharacterized membrane-anchored protein YhcB (DUF1043 family)